jgi:hypothetical protein
MLSNSNASEARPPKRHEPAETWMPPKPGLAHTTEVAASGGSRWRRCLADHARRFMTRLTPELSRAAKRRRLGRIVRRHRSKESAQWAAAALEPKPETIGCAAMQPKPY